MFCRSVQLPTHRFTTENREASSGRLRARDDERRDWEDGWWWWWKRNEKSKIERRNWRKTEEKKKEFKRTWRRRNETSSDGGKKRRQSTANIKRKKHTKYIENIYIFFSCVSRSPLSSPVLMNCVLCIIAWCWLFFEVEKRPKRKQPQAHTQHSAKECRGGSQAACVDVDVWV